jgi:hypothetical protein
MPIGVPNRDHCNIVVGAGISAGRAADTGDIIDNDSPVFDRTMNGTRRAADHTHWVGAMHAGISHHQAVKGPTMPPEARITAMRRRTSPDAIIAPHTAVKIDDHSARRVDEALFDRPLHHCIVSD